MDNYGKPEKSNYEEKVRRLAEHLEQIFQPNAVDNSEALPFHSRIK